MGQGFPTVSFLVKKLKNESKVVHHIRTSMLVQDLIPFAIWSFFPQYLLLLSFTMKTESVFEASAVKSRLHLSPAPWAFLPHPLPPPQPPGTWLPTLGPSPRSSPQTASCPYPPPGAPAQLTHPLECDRRWASLWPGLEGPPALGSPPPHWVHSSCQLGPSSRPSLLQKTLPPLQQLVRVHLLPLRPRALTSQRRAPA